MLLRDEQARWLTPDCRGVLCLDVNGVLNRMSDEDIEAMAKLIRERKPNILCVIISYQRKDPHWPETASPRCPWRSVVKECEACYFPIVRRYESWGNGPFLHRSWAMNEWGAPQNFWIFEGNKQQLINSMNVKCCLIDDKRHPLKDEHWMCAIRKADLALKMADIFGYRFGDLTPAQMQFDVTAPPNICEKSRVNPDHEAGWREKAWQEAEWRERGWWFPEDGWESEDDWEQEDSKSRHPVKEQPGTVPWKSRDEWQKPDQANTAEGDPLGAVVKRFETNDYLVNAEERSARIVPALEFSGLMARIQEAGMADEPSSPNGTDATEVTPEPSPHLVRYPEKIEHWYIWKATDDPAATQDE